MRVLIVGINYRPEVAGIGPYTAGLAQHLAGAGHDVSVVCGLPHYPAWRVAPFTRRRLFSSETIEGVHVTRAAHYVPARQTALGRVLYEATSLLTSLAAANAYRPKPDAVLGIVPALGGGIVARLVGQRHGIPYGLLFQDLMGPGSRQSGIEGGGVVGGVASMAEAWAARRASAIGIISEAFAPYLAELGIEPSRTHLVSNWALPMEPSLAPDDVRRQFGWTDGRLVALHGGNLGLKQGLEQLIQTARLASHRGSRIRFVFAGGGNQEAAIREQARGLDNVDFLGIQPDGMYASLLRAADVLLLSERPSQLTMSLPSKLTSYLAAGRPIIAAVPEGGSTERAVRASGAALVVPAGDPEAILGALERLAVEGELAERLATAGARHAEERFQQGPSLERASAFVEAIAAGR